jgi:DNA-binding beta-propeller fold protein YncE
MNGVVYVADTGNHRIQMFAPDGKFLNLWGTRGPDDGQFDHPLRLTVDSRGRLYVADSGNDRIQIFTSTGKFIAGLGRSGHANGQLKSPAGVATGKRGRVYVADSDNSRVQVFDPKGQYVTHWGLSGSEKGSFNSPHGIALGAGGNVFIVDRGNHRIQIFSPDGRFLGARGSRGDKEWQFESPRDLAFSPRGLLYVADTANHRIQAFTPKGDFVAQWGSKGSDKGQFNLPSGIAVAGDGSVYISDSGNHRIQKFDPRGNFVALWGEPGKGRGEFKLPSGIAVHTNGNVYVADTGNHRIQAFNSEGKFIRAWGAYGQGRNEFIAPEGLTVDKRGHVLVADTGNDRVQRFSTEGKFVAAWGESGGSPGEMNRPVALAARSDGSLYVAGQSNHRIQLFVEAAPMTNQKLIIVAGGGPFAGNNLWDATQACANFAYLAATFQGFSRDTIHYLSANSTFDLDGNGHLDDVDDDARNSNLQDAVTKWAVDADSLVLYLVDHGGPGTFRMSGSEILNAGDLAKWLDQLRQKISGRIIVIYDACESGSFLSVLKPAAGAKRTVIASTSPGEEAQFVSQGTVSFSNFFWNHIFNGADVKDAFKWARDAIGYVPMAQNALLDANGNGAGNEAVDLTLSRNVYIGNATGYFGSAPKIASVSPDQTIAATSLARLYADGVTDADGVARVWAVIRPPDYRVSNTANPLQAFPSIDLTATVGNRYEAPYAGFNIEGTHYISVFARDRIGYTSQPHNTSVSVGSPLRRRAVIVAGGEASDSNWPSIESNLRLCCQALKFQGYTDDDIYLMSPAAVAGVNLPITSPTLGNLAQALTTWAPEKTQDLVVYLIGPGGVQHFKLNPNEMLWAHHLDAWLDDLQDLIPGALTVIHDADHGGSFLPLLKPGTGKERILISSTSNQQASFASGGDLSFSAFFWREVFNGANVRDAFRTATAAVGYAGSGQSALLDDNGNGIGNEAGLDGRLAHTYTIGFGIQLFGDAPVIEAIAPEITLTGQNSAKVWVENVTSTGTIEKVWAVITPPGFTPDDDLPVVTLSPTGNGRYEGAYSNFVRFGLYRVAVYAKDANGSLALQKETTVRQTIGPDIYEIDDSFDRARVITLNGTLPQQHNFHDDGDQDWVRFYGVAGQVYEIKISGVGDATDPVIEIYGSDGTSLLKGPRSTGLEGEDELMIWTCPINGIYYVRIFYKNAGGFGKNAGYDLEIYRPVQTGSGVIKGYINDAADPGRAIVDATIVTDGGGSAISLPPHGSYLMTHPAGTSWTVTASKPGGYHGLSHFPVEVRDLGAITPLDFLLAPVDTDADGLPDHIETAIVCLDVNDADSDEDGIVDGDEDKNKNGIRDADETDPCKPDTDGDLIHDGTESGLTLSDVGPGTNSAVFKPDADASTKTDPTDDDTDNDRRSDGQEDKNRNGRVDAGETDPNRFNARTLSHLLLLLLQD